MNSWMRAALCATLMTVAAACASPARMSAMIPERTAETLISEDSPLAKAITVASVSGGKDTNPMWMSEVGNPEFQEALKSALATHAMLADGTGGKYELEASLVALEQPILGISMTVTAQVEYRLFDVKSRQKLWSEKISLPYTASFSDAFLGVERLRLANEGAIRVNIQALLKELVARSKEFGELQGQVRVVFAGNLRSGVAR